VELGLNDIPVITKADSIQFAADVYTSSTGVIIQRLDFLRIALTCLLLAVIPIRIYQKYKHSDDKSIKTIVHYGIRVCLQIKNLLLIISFSFLLSGFINFLSSSIDPIKFQESDSFRDLYAFASRQKEARSNDTIACYLIFLYSLKYFQYLKSLNVFFIALKKSSLEYVVLLVTIIVIFLGLSILTNFVFGTYIYEYKTFIESIATNIKIFVFIENTSVIEEFLAIYSSLSIIFLIIFIFLIRFYLLNLFYPIFIEYYKNELEKHNMNKKFVEEMQGAKPNEKDEKLTFVQSKFIC
jgi:hypothetical protein